VAWKTESGEGKEGKVMRKLSFTLMELLVVMAIISVLMGILLPVLSKVRDQAKREKARHSVVQVAAAWACYLGDYRHFPEANGSPVAISQSGCEMDTNAMSILAGKDGFYNDRGFIYMDFATNDLKAGGLIDPWGTRYQVSLDNGLNGDGGPAKAYDGKVYVPHDTVGDPPNSVPKSAVSWSKGIDKNDNTVLRRVDDVKSWD